MNTPYGVSPHVNNEYPTAGCNCTHCNGLLRIFNKKSDERITMYSTILPPGGSGPFPMNIKQPFIVYTISGAYAFEDLDTATAFAARLISRGDELKVGICKAVAIKSLAAKTDPDVEVTALGSGEAT